MTKKDGIHPTNVAAIEERRDNAIRRALNTPPKHHKDMKKGKGKKRQDKPTASEKRT